jgi:hypothetical protein
MPTHIWVSDCGHYYALAAPVRPPAYDVLARTGDAVWLAHRYEAGGDPAYASDVRYTHAEFPRLVVGWTNLGGWTRGRTRYVGAFALRFLDVRQDLQLLPLASRVTDPDPYLAVYTAVFHRRRRLSHACWATVQARIRHAVDEGHARLVAHHPQTQRASGHD